MPIVVVYVTQSCPYCTRARHLLDKKKVTYTLIDLDQQPEKRAEMERKSGRTSVPQIFIDNYHVGGFDDMAALNVAGKLDPLLQASPP